jgi:hypothetical protein
MVAYCPSVPTVSSAALAGTTKVANTMRAIITNNNDLETNKERFMARPKRPVIRLDE